MFKEMKQIFGITTGFLQSHSSLEKPWNSPSLSVSMKACASSSEMFLDLKQTSCDVRVTEHIIIPGLCENQLNY